MDLTLSRSMLGSNILRTGNGIEFDGLFFAVSGVVLDFRTSACALAKSLACPAARSLSPSVLLVNIRGVELLLLAASSFFFL